MIKKSKHARPAKGGKSKTGKTLPQVKLGPTGRRLRTAPPSPKPTQPIVEVPQEATMPEQKQAGQSQQSGQGPDEKPQDPSDRSKPRRGPADPSSPSENQQSDASAKQARAAADQQVLKKLQDKYTDVHKTAADGSMYPFEGVCLRCGFHTLELSEDAAKKIIEAHIAIHWRDAVTGIQLQGGMGPLGMEGAAADLRAKAMQAQEKGAQKGGQEALKPVEAEQKKRDEQMKVLAEQLSGSASGGQQSQHGS